MMPNQHNSRTTTRWLPLRTHPTRLLRPGWSCGTRIGILPVHTERSECALSAVEGNEASPSLLAWPLAARHFLFDRYTCRAKNAASPLPSSKLPNLIVTEFSAAAPRNVRYIPLRLRKSLDTDTLNIATPVSRYFRHNPRRINKTAKISRHVFEHPIWMFVPSGASRARDLRHRMHARRLIGISESQFGKDPTVGRSRVARHDEVLQGSL